MTSFSASRSVDDDDTTTDRRCVCRSGLAGKRKEVVLTRGQAAIEIAILNG